jgi:hypothetical protein
MAYDKNNLAEMCVPFFNGTWRLWAYRSADAIATVNTTGYISDGYDMGMKRNDCVFVVDTTNNLTYLCTVMNAATSASPGVDLSDGVALNGANAD